MKNLLKIAKLFLLVCAVWLWLWFFVTQLPIMLTSGVFMSFTGIALLALSVIVPGVLIWDKVKGKIKPST